MIARCGEIGNLGKQASILNRERKLGMLAPHDQVIVIGNDFQLFVAAGPQDRPNVHSR